VLVLMMNPVVEVGHQEEAVGSEAEVEEEEGEVGVGKQVEVVEEVVVGVGEVAGVSPPFMNLEEQE